jgi:hypothetical protein
VHLRSDVFLILVIPDSLPESRWADEKPRVGSRIADASGRTWRVSEVLQSGRRTFTVRCEYSAEGLGAVPELASDMLERVRKAVRSAGLKTKREA